GLPEEIANMKNDICNCRLFPSRILLIAVAILFMLWRSSEQRAGAEEIGWQPAKTWVMAVGVLNWKAGRLYHPFPKENRRDVDLVKFFREHGVPEGQIVFLEDEHATKQHIEQALLDMLKKTRAGDLLVVYYAGHGTRDEGVTCFANYDITGATLKSGWQIPS